MTCFYVPAHIIDHIAKNARQLGMDPEPVQRTALASQAQRQERRATMNATLASLTPPHPGKGDRQIFKDEHQWVVGVTLVRGEGDTAVAEANANAAYDGLGATRDFYREVLGRDSIDNSGLTLLGNVDFGVQYDNAFWDGAEMVFGNGDNVIFKDFTLDVDVCGHELTHGVTQYTAGLLYTDQPGAMNEAFSDIFGSCVDQYVHKLDAGEHNWLIGEDVMADQLYGEAIRSMAHPGTAYDDPILGKDPQPARHVRLCARRRPAPQQRHHQPGLLPDSDRTGHLPGRPDLVRHAAQPVAERPVQRLRVHLCGASPDPRPRRQGGPQRRAGRPRRVPGGRHQLTSGRPVRPHCRLRPCNITVAAGPEHMSRTPAAPRYRFSQLCAAGPAGGRHHLLVRHGSVCFHTSWIPR